MTDTADGGAAVETSRDAKPGFDEFVAARSGRLLRTAYLLTGDSGLAEDLLQTTLTKAWFAWRRIDGEPEPYVRRVLVNTYGSWWRRKWNGEQPTHELPERHGPAGHDHAERSSAGHDLWSALGSAPA
jgi:DNA-directed RNA polymerase specialized sigma24 family protein